MAHNITPTNSSIVLNLIGKWVKRLEDLPGWRDFNRKKIAFTIFHDNTNPYSWKGKNEFEFPEKIEKEHRVIMSYFELYNSLQSLKDCEFYFRRYPFRGLPMRKYDYLTNSCELYFNKFYEFRERIKNTGNSIKTLLPENHFNVGVLIKRYDKIFESELKERNLLHHHFSFSEVNIDKLRIISILELEQKSNTIGDINTQYRRICIEWVKRIRDRSSQIEIFLEEISIEMLRRCDFLKMNQE